MKNEKTNNIMRWGIGIIMIILPLILILGFAAHPDLSSMKVGYSDVSEWVAEFRGNHAWEIGHVAVLFATPLFIALALWMAVQLRRKGAEWFALIGASLAVIGATMLAADKGALGLVPGVLGTLPDAQFNAMLPGLQLMINYAGLMVIAKFYILLIIGLLILSIGFYINKIIPKWQSIFLILGFLLLLNPDIDLISLIASISFAIGSVPMGIKVIRDGFLLE